VIIGCVLEEQMINVFCGGEKIKVDSGLEYTINPVLTCDLKALMKMMGLYNVYHLCSRWWCPFCRVNTRYE
jgi:hypothetical protein